MRHAFTLLLAATVSTATVLAQRAPIVITADLSDGSRKLYHAEVDLPVKPGPAAVTTPQWIPGNHRPTGPVDDITGVVFSVAGANGERQILPWRRDDVDLYKFHVDVPKGVTTLHARLDCIVLGRVTDEMAVLEWEKLLLYPADRPVREIPIQPNVTVPTGWGIGTALAPTSPYDPQHPAGGTVHYALTNVEQLQDSPVITGKHFHEFALAPEARARGGARKPGARGGRDVRLAPLRRVPLPAHALGPRRRRGARARAIVGQRRGREGLQRSEQAARCRGPSLARVHPLMERQVPAPGKPLSD